MTLSTARIGEPPAWLGTLFDRIVCGVDGTESSRVAVEQAARLLHARRILELVSVVDQRPVVTSTEAPDADDLERRYEAARCALREACLHHPHAWSRLRSGDPGSELLSAVREAQATLAVVGAPPSGRLGGIVLESVGTHLLRSAPCSVLIARPTADEDAFPRSIVVGHDGSTNATAAAAVAKELSYRFDAGVRILVAEGGGPAKVDRIAQEELEWSFLPPVEALATASAEADLLVVGSHGVRGAPVLGGVSERLAHLARCSVLVVREPPASAPANRDGDAVPDIEC